MTAGSGRGTGTALALVVLGVLAGCESGPPSPQGAPPSTAAPSGGETTAAAVQKIGQTLAGAELVKVADLLKDPSSYEGKTVRVQGKVEDFCHHARAWFSVTADSGGGMVRVFTKPRFEVPMDCKGKQAVAEGKVELITISPERAKHFGEEHKFLRGVEVKPGEPVIRPVVRAFGAELR